MPFRITREDITCVHADAIVNTANPLPKYGRGTDEAIYRAAGAEELLEERKKIGRIHPGEAAATPAFALPAKYIIHTVGPVWRGGLFRERDILLRCYENSLNLARELGCGSIAFPLISAGVYRFPKMDALETAIHVFEEYERSSETDMEIILVLLDAEAFALSGRLFSGVRTYLKEHLEPVQGEPEQEEWEREAQRREEEWRQEARRREARRLEEEWRRETRRREAQSLEEKWRREAQEQEEEWDSLEDFQDGNWGQMSDDSAEIPEQKALSESSRERPGRKGRLKSGIPGEAAKGSAGNPLSGNLSSGSLPSGSPPAGSLPPVAARKPSAGGSAPKASFKEVKSADHTRGKRAAEPPEKPRARRVPRSLDEWISHIGETWQESLFRLIDEKGYTDTEVYKRANIDRRLFSRIRSNREYQPKKSTAVAFALALRLNLDETTDMLARAGYALSPSSCFDLIIRFFIEQGEYDTYIINLALFEHEQPLLGA